MEEDKIVLDRKSFEALAVDTRVRILKSLKVRRKTLSEISKEQGMSVSGVKEHLETLEGVGLIVKKDDGHKWKYYELTKKGSEIVAPRELRVWILLSISTIALMASMIAFFSAPPMMAEQPPVLEMGAESSNEPVLTMGAYSAEADTAVGEHQPGDTARNLADGSEEAPQATSGAAAGAGAEGEKAVQTPDLSMPIIVGAVSALTLLACAGILMKNRMGTASP